MAIFKKELGFCKRCQKYGLFGHVNYRQTELYCNNCQAAVEQEQIDNAVQVLKSKGVTPEMYQRFWDKYIKS